MTADCICDCTCHQYGQTECACNGECCQRPYKKYISPDGIIDRGNWIDLRATEKEFNTVFPIKMKDKSPEPMLKRALDKWLEKVR